MPRIYQLPCWLSMGAIFLFGTGVVFGQQTFRPGEFPPSALRRLEDLPLSRFRDQIERLPAEARARSLAWLGNFHFTDQDLAALQVDASGGIFYADHFNLAPVAAAPGSEPVVAGAAVPLNPFPSHLIFHSRRGAPNVIFLNFSGENVSNTAWNGSVGRTNIPAMPFSTDSDYATFSDVEQVAIKRIWQRVAEDYAGFNIDVTTERPTSFGPRTAHALITRNTDANGEANPSSTSGGVAYVNVFGGPSYANYRPAWIYYNNLSSDESYTSEAASHEVGHNLGLSHDGKSDGTDYYNGHGSGATSWGPIMGIGYNRNVSQWSKGEYYLANNTQDDLATIAAKLSYRGDDHGNLPASATALTISAGTNVLATMPETDPANTNLANKGVIERNTDVDVFSFATGNGPLTLTVRPWVMPSGLTFGGNLDLLVELYDVNGVLLLTNNPSSQTSASIQTNLQEGIYYLHIRNTGVGNPTNSTPTGYTSYASAGQYFISGAIIPSGLVIPPGADLQITDITEADAGAKQFTVTYSDNRAIDVSTIDSSDILVTGPNGFNRAAQLVSVDVSSNGTPRVAAYSVLPPTGAVWTQNDNGIYTVQLQSSQVSDTEGATVAEGGLGQFNVAVPRAVYFASMDVDPGWTFEAQWEYGIPTYSSGGPTSGFTGTHIIGYNLAGNYENRLTNVYATTPSINCSGTSRLTLRFRRWLRLRNGDTAMIEVSTNATSWTTIWATTKTVADNSWQEIQYSLPDWAVGSPSVRLRWGLASGQAQNDIGWNIDDVQLLGDGNIDTTPPVASLNVANITSGGSPTHSFTVTYSDNTAVRIASLGSADLLVTGPNGYSNLVEFAGVDTAGDGSPRTATYDITAPGATWGSADNGVFQIVIQNGEVSDTLNNAMEEMVLGEFTVGISTNQQVLLVTPTLLTVPEGSNALFTIRLAEPPSANVVVTVVQVSGSTNIVILSGATNQFTPLNWSIPVPVTLTALLDADQNNATPSFECLSDGLLTVVVLATEDDTTPDNVLSVTVNNPLWGSANPAGNTFPVGASVQVSATPSSYFRFVEWRGNYLGTNNPLMVVMTTNVTLEAVFAEIVTTNHATPYWWLASNGYTQDFETAELSIGANGMALWQSYIAGLNPNDPDNPLRIRVERGSDATRSVLRWNTVENRLYTILQTTNLPGGMAPIPGATNLPASIQSFTNVLNQDSAAVFYRLEVHKP